MNSFNHYAYGAVGEWVWARVAGLDWDRDRPGFRAVQLRPLFDKRLGWVSARYAANTGVYESRWEYQGDSNIVSWVVRIPPNCSGALVPDASWQALYMNGHLIDGPLDLQSGEHRFKVMM